MEPLRALDAALRDVLGSIAGGPDRVLGGTSLDEQVWRVELDPTVAAGAKSVIVKELDPVVAHRNRMLAERWLPAVGLEALGPGLLACAGSAGGDRAWQVYEDFGDQDLAGASGDRERIRTAIRGVAQLHLRFADHAVLGECRLWGGDLGRAFYGGHARDALRALDALALSGEGACVRGRLQEQLQRLLDEEDERWRAWEEHGGPETLVHGDLWPTNVFVVSEGEEQGLRLRLIDWDHVGVAQYPYDLSTLLGHLPVERRLEGLADYAEAVAAAGWRLPDPAALNALFDTAERGRIASQIVWPALVLLRDQAELRSWAAQTLADVADWFETLAPVLPGEQDCAR